MIDIMLKKLFCGLLMILELDFSYVGLLESSNSMSSVDGDKDDELVNDDEETALERVIREETKRDQAIVLQRI